VRAQTVLARDRSFLVLDVGSGDVDAGSDALAGLFVADTRHLSVWRLRLDGEPLRQLSVTTTGNTSRHVFLPDSTRDVGPLVTVQVWRHLGPGLLTEQVAVLGHADCVVHLDLEAGADFVDQFMLRTDSRRAGQQRREPLPEGLALVYERGRFRRTTRVTATTQPAVTATGLHWRVPVVRGGSWTTTLRVSAGTDAPDGHDVDDGSGIADLQARDEADDDTFLAGAPALTTDWPGLAECYDRALADLALLRVRLAVADGPVPGAGIPWFLTLFGRDSLLTSYFALPYLPELAAATLRALAATQGRVDDPDREEQPGKILHEWRSGESTECGDLPFGRYYGTVDATPLFLVLLDEYHRWTGDDTLVAELEQSARAALRWLDGFGDGYLTYLSHHPRGLVNHCWKDSATSMRFADGSTAVGPIAVCEAQGYAYDAWRRVARLAAGIWRDDALAADCERAAGELRARFSRDFWMPARGYPALALDGEGRQVDAITSDAGHLLWSGILDRDRADAVARRVVGTTMSSGWGVRTMAADEAAYNPVEYHNGTVWPHDTAIVAAGLARYGHRQAAADLAAAVIEAATHFDHRPPEVFAGYTREETGTPVPYPTACSPQAWASAAVLSLVTTTLGLAPDRAATPVLPPRATRLELGGRRGS
jgi:glycogen debranching enzyme